MKNAIWNSAHYMLSRLNGDYFAALYNFLNIFNRNGLRCIYRDGTYHLRDSATSQIHIVRPSRYRYYGGGINRRLASLFQDYTGDRVALRKGDVVIDCGANIGEFSLYCARLGATCYCFEPDPTEFAALEKNLAGNAKVFPWALWHTETELTLNLNNETGDTSVALNDCDGAWLTKAVRLDSLEDLANARHVKLLKLEAEGFEQEVLLGAERLLDRIEYIAADLGPERGPDQLSTLPEVTNYLTARNFEILYYQPSRSIMLFKNKARPDWDGTSGIGSAQL